MTICRHWFYSELHRSGVGRSVVLFRRFAAVLRHLRFHLQQFLHHTLCFGTVSLDFIPLGLQLCLLFCFVFGKLLHFDLEDIILASNANIGGPTTAAGMAISQGWTKLVGPVMLIGTFGYVIGTYLGVVVGGLLGA